MHKPLHLSYWTRCKQLIRGLLFYNTIYWRRASDGLNPPRLTPQERKIYAPPKNLDVIKPREKPRARKDQANERRMLAELARLRKKIPASTQGAMRTTPLLPSVLPGATTPTVQPRKLATAPVSALPGGFRLAPPPEGKRVKRRRKRRVSKAREDGASAPGLMARLLQKFIG